jgi:hypothetical protein
MKHAPSKSLEKAEKAGYYVRRETSQSSGCVMK